RMLTSKTAPGVRSAFPRIAATKSGQLMCYENRTTAKATDIPSSGRIQDLQIEARLRIECALHGPARTCIDRAMLAEEIACVPIAQRTQCTHHSHLAERRRDLVHHCARTPQR